MVPQPRIRVVRFGEYELDLESSELRKHGHKVPLPDQAFQILAMLLERPGEMIPRDQLIARLWPDGTVVEFDRGINSSVRRLRAVLNDSAERPRYVETLPKRGYRFIYPVEAGQKPSSELVSDVTPSSFGSPTHRVWMIVGTFACVLASGAGLLYWRTTQRQLVRSVAVLPLVNATQNPATEYLSDGISEEIINTLSVAPHLRVIARTSAFAFRGKQIDPREVGRQLGVGAVLTGRLSRRGETLVIQTDLIQVSDGSELWGANYTRPVSRLSDLQFEVAADIADQLRLKLAGAEKRRPPRRYTESKEAYELYLKAVTALPAGNSEASLPLLYQAIDRDPNFALAYLRLANVYMNLADSRRLPSREALPKAREAAKKALELDENLGEAHVELARVAMNLDWNWAGAERELKRGIELNSNIGHIFYSLYLAMMGRSRDALVEAQRAEAIDPLSPDIQWRTVFIHWLTRDYDRAIEKANTPGATSLVRETAALPLAETGNYAKSIALLTELIATLHTDSPRGDAAFIGHLAYAYARGGQRKRAEQICRELERRAATEGLGAYEAAFLEGVFGEKDEAFRWLDVAYQQRDPGLKYLKMDPCLDPLRDDSRFSALVRRVGLSQ